MTMRPFILATTALLLTLTATAAVRAQQPAVSPLDATMKRMWPALGTSIKAALSLSYADARTPLADVRKGLAEAEAFFAMRNRADAVTAAKAAQAKLDAFDQSLAAAATAVPAAPMESPVDPLMKKIGPASAAIGRALSARAWDEARMQVAATRAAFLEVETFFAANNAPDGVKFAKEALTRLTELETQLAGDNVDAGSAIATNRQLNATCGSCHNEFRIRAGANFILKPGSAPTADLLAARTALRELQAACTSCHTTYRQVARGEWVLRPGV